MEQRIGQACFYRLDVGALQPREQGAHTAGDIEANPAG
jgi:hypothetical protein